MKKTSIKQVHDAKRSMEIEALRVVIAYSEMQRKQIEALLGSNILSRIRMMFKTRKEKQALLLVHAAEFVAMHGAGGNAAQKEKKARKAK